MSRRRWGNQWRSENQWRSGDQWRSARWIVSPAGFGLLAGCQRSPSFNVLGSYFPGWIACIVVAILITALLRWLINRIEVEQQIPMLPVFYVCLTLLIACTLWLIAFE